MRSVAVDIFLVAALKIQIVHLTAGSPDLLFPFMVFKQRGGMWGLNTCRGGVVERKVLTLTRWGA